MSKIKTFRGQIDGDDAGGSDKITLHTIDGSTGYQIKKIQIIQQSPGASNCEGLVVVWNVKPTTTQIATKTINLSDDSILAVAFYSASSSAQIYPEDMTIIIDNKIFNQDIYLSYIDVSTTNDNMNYYVELEQVKLDSTENAVATLTHIKNR
tara:strand:- start:66 stop:521 length:456 start_codon:yes stop_codon:yes gene_type:complete